MLPSSNSFPTNCSTVSVLDCGKLLCFRYYSGSTLDCVAQTEPLLTKDPPDKPRKFVKVKQKIKCNGIENDGFQDEYEFPRLKTSNSLEELRTEKKLGETNEPPSGTKKKPTSGLTRSESTNISGAKKKIRPRPACKEPSKDYYQIWAASSSSETTKETTYNDEDDEEAPPLPPRSLHKPLKRSNALKLTPPVVHRQHKPKAQKPEDTFGFELIDTDEPKKTVITNSFNMNEFSSNSTPKHQPQPTSPLKRLIGSDNYITTVFSAKTAHLTNSSPTKELFNIEHEHSHSSTSALSSNSSQEALTTDISLKPHKPLCRQLSGSSKKPSEVLKTPLHEKVSSGSSSTDTNSEDAGNECKTPLHNSSLSKDMLRPHPRALARVAGTVPVCPPTPTHHSRRLKNADLRPPVLKATDSEPGSDNSESLSDLNRSTDSVDSWTTANGDLDGAMETRNFHPVLTKSDLSFNPRLSLRALTELHVDDLSAGSTRDDSRLELRLPEDNADGEASGGIPLPLRHLRSTRLPSIPERSHRVLAVSELPGEHEEPLPPCKYCNLLHLIKLKS